VQVQVHTVLFEAVLQFALTTRLCYIFSSSSFIEYFFFIYICFCSLYNHYENGTLKSVKDMKGYQKIAIAMNGGTSENWNDSSLVRTTNC
jgi:hypothetical protein